MTPLEQAMARLEAACSLQERASWATMIDPQDFAAIRTVLDELRRLRAALPKTADGVTVMPGMEVWEKMAEGNQPLRLKTAMAAYSDDDVDQFLSEPSWQNCFCAAATAKD